MNRLPTKEIIKKAALGNFEIFREHYLGYTSRACQEEWIRQVESHDRVLTLCPGGHGKSMTAVDYATWLIVKNRFERVLNRDIGELNVVIVSVSESLGVDWLRQIKNHLESPKVTQDFGIFKNSDKWAADAIIVLSPFNKGARVDHPTVRVLGIGGQIFGPRADLIIADDIVDKENSSTEDQRKKLWERFSEGCRGWLIGRTKGKIWVIGTRQHSKDLYAHILRNLASHVTKTTPLSTYRTGIYRALVQQAVNFDTGDILCPEDRMHTLSYFSRAKQEMGTASFNKRFMNVAIDEADAAFKEEWFETLYDNRRPYGQVHPGWRVYIGIDPAVGIGRGRSHIGIAAVAYDAKDPSKRFLINYISDQMLPAAQADIALQWYVEYRAMMIRIERNACQRYLKDYIIERAQKYGVSPKIEMTFTGSNKWDADYGVNIIAAQFENGSYSLPYTESAQEKTHHLRDILLESEAAKPPDILMAIWFIEQHLQTLAKRRVARIELEKPPYLQLMRVG